MWTCLLLLLIIVFFSGGDSQVDGYGRQYSASYSHANKGVTSQYGVKNISELRTVLYPVNYAELTLLT